MVWRNLSNVFFASRTKQNTVTEEWPCRNKSGSFLCNIKDLKERDCTPWLLACSGPGHSMKSIRESASTTSYLDRTDKNYREPRSQRPGSKLPLARRSHRSQENCLPMLMVYYSEKSCYQLKRAHVRRMKSRRNLMQSSRWGLW